MVTMATSNDVEAAIREVVGDGKFAQPGFYPDEMDELEPPYVNYMPYDYDLVMASDQTWIWRVPYDVVLCTKHRTPALERQLIDALTAHGVTIKEVQPSADFDNKVYYFEVFCDPVIEIFE
jgi:hypothetical protein